MHPIRPIRTTAIVALVIIAAMAVPPSIAAEESGKSWQPPPPMPDDFDWVQTTSGEWLKGEIVAMYEDTLELTLKSSMYRSSTWRIFNRSGPPRSCRWHSTTT